MTLELHPLDISRYCPHCNADLTYIVNNIQYSSAVSVEVRGIYDGGLFYYHRDGCGKAWHRWMRPEMQEKAQPWIDDYNRKAEANE